MPKLEQPQPDAEQLLAMARPRRGKLKEIKQTPEQKQKIDEMIETGLAQEREYAKTKDLNALKQAVKIYTDLRDYVRQIKKEQAKELADTTIIETKTPEGMEVRFELREQLEYWKKFYKDHGIDWINLPDKIAITEEQAEQMKQLIEKLGFNKMIIIPEGLVGEPEIEEYEEKGEKRVIKPAEHYEELHELMTNKATKVSKKYEKSWESDNYKDDGGFGGSQDLRQGLRIILVKDVKDLNEDELHKKTLGASVVQDLKKPDEPYLEGKGGLLETIQKEYEVAELSGLTESEYLVYQLDYFKRTGQHLDKIGWTWLSASRRPASGRAPYVGWGSGDDRLGFCSFSLVFRGGNPGCRLASSFSV